MGVKLFGAPQLLKTAVCCCSLHDGFLCYMVISPALMVHYVVDEIGFGATGQSGISENTLLLHHYRFQIIENRNSCTPLRVPIRSEVQQLYACAYREATVSVWEMTVQRSCGTTLLHHANAAHTHNTQASTRTVGGQENGPGDSANSADHSQPHQRGATRTTAVVSFSSPCSTGTMSRWCAI